MLRFGELGDTLGDNDWWNLKEIEQAVVVEAVHKMHCIIVPETVVIGWYVNVAIVRIEYN
jgi:hypothetical protein